MQQTHPYRIHTSQRTNQKCSKSVPAPLQAKFNLFLPSLFGVLIFSPPTTDTQTVGQNQQKPLLTRD